MRILRHDYTLHSFNELPKERNIFFGYVTVVTDADGGELNVLYSTKYGWGTVEYSPEGRISQEEMAKKYVGWLSFNKSKIIPDSSNWLTVLNDLREEVEMKRHEDPEQYKSESEQGYWNNIDELYSKLIECCDFAEAIA